MTPEETGATFTENALLKARFYFERARIATLADDGGLEVDALGGEPGVRSHRWLGSGGDDSDEALVAEVIRRMDGVETARRTARIRATLALIHEEDGRAAREDCGGRNRGRDRRARVSRNSSRVSVSRGARYSRSATATWANSATRKRPKSASAGLRVLELRDELERIAAGRARGLRSRRKR